MNSKQMFDHINRLLFDAGTEIIGDEVMSHGEQIVGRRGNLLLTCYECGVRDYAWASIEDDNMSFIVAIGEERDAVNQGLFLK